MPRNICNSENIGPRGLNVSFCVVDRNEESLAARSNQIFPVIHVFWSYDNDTTYLTIYFRPCDPSMFGSTQELFSAKKRPFNEIKLKAGNSLATWFSGDKILFIALSRLRPREACIDIQLDTIPNGTEGLLQLSKADPLRAHEDYPNKEHLIDSPQTWLPWKESSGREMYGVTYDWRLPFSIRKVSRTA